jgi:hypothetical protein
MSRQVRGALFADYVRMMRRRKDIDWRALLDPRDLEYLTGRISPEAWYPMDAFQRLGMATLEHLGKGDLESVRAWGRLCAQRLLEAHPRLCAHNDPRESLMRFQVVRQTFFDFPAVTVHELSDLEARLHLAYDMAPPVEAAAAYQVMGFFEQLLLLAGAERVQARFVRRRWEDGGPETVLALLWSRPVTDTALPRAPRGM